MTQAYGTNRVAPDQVAAPPIDREKADLVAEIGWDRLSQIRAWEPPGPVALSYMQSDAFVRGIMGPYGSGKTVTSYIDALMKAKSQPIALDGKRYFFTTIIADTYGHLYANTIKSWHDWFPKELGVWKGSQDRPALHQLKIRDEYGEIIWNVDFMAMGEHSAEDALDGFEPSHAFINGASRVNQDVLDYLIGRVKRAPRRLLIGDEAFACKWNGITLDWNPPDIDHWLHSRFVTNKPENFEFYPQPGGRDPDAENRRNLSPDYYDTMVMSNSHNPPFIARFVDNKWGWSLDGQPVYPTWTERHKTECLQAIPGRTIYVGLDGGQTLNAAAVFCQLDDEGQWRVLCELAPGRAGASNFAGKLVKLIRERFAGFRFKYFCDPTADDGADKEGGELSWLETVEKHVGQIIERAPTNERTARLDAVGQALDRAVPGQRPGLLVSATDCPALISGFGGKYCFKRYKEGGKDAYDDKPSKTHPYSDVHDALQYVILSVEGLDTVQQGSTGRKLSGAGMDVRDEPDAGGDMPGQWGWSPFD